jgi:RimJ/RimL family protein N-acetyltransferase
MTNPLLLDRLETGRLVLRRREVGDAEVLHRLWTERDPRVPARRRLDAEGRPTVADLSDLLRCESDSTDLGVLSVVRRGEGDVVGYCGLFAVEERPADEPELAYELLAPAHGQGYATEAARAVVDWSRGAGLARLWADVWEWNTASRRVLEKLDFREVERSAPGPHGVNLTTVLDLQAASNPPSR